MPRIFGFAVGIIWIVFAFFAFRNSAAGWAEGHSDIGFWWGVVTVLLSIAATIALTGTLRHRAQGPSK